MRAAVFIGSELHRLPGFGGDHPLAIPRIATVMDLCAALGWLAPTEYRAAPQASPEILCEFHRVDYVAALRAADEAGGASLAVRQQFGLGTRENPIFRGVFARAASAVGGSRLAAELALEGAVPFHPAGGTHHGRPERASGFCYFNDPVFALRRFAAADLARILYVDLDAHHGDGVQEAVAADTRIHTVSIHEAGRWPYTGAAEDRGGGRSHNYPVPAGFNDSELDFLMQAAVLPLVEQLAPEALVIACGADALAGDPLARMGLSNQALWRAVEALVERAPAAVVLGGGGYNPWTVARCWAGLWGRLSGRGIPAELPEAAQQVLKDLHCELLDEEMLEESWTRTLADAPRAGPVRAEITDLAARAAARRREWAGVGVGLHP